MIKTLVRNSQRTNKKIKKMFHFIIKALDLLFTTDSIETKSDDGKCEKEWRW